MRAFIAIQLPVDVRQSLASLQQELARAGADVKWVEPANLHLTVKFLDEISEEQRAGVERVMQRITAGQPAFSIRLDGVGAFPSPDAPRVVWVGCAEGADALTRVAEAIERETRALGMCSSDRPFAAHLTIGRVRSPRGRRELSRALQATAWQAPGPWRAGALTLYHSVLSSAGPRYTALAEIPLAAVPSAS